MSDPKGFLNSAYELDSADDTRALYADWAQSYDQEMAANGYASPSRTAAALVDAGAALDAPLLDLGCGTGLSGQALRAVGFSVIDGSDFSPEMLEAAEAKGAYRTLTLGDLGNPIPATPGQYTTITAIGVFSPGHAPPSLISDVTSLLPNGGLFAFSLNDHALAVPDYADAIEALVESAAVTVLSDGYGDHMPGIGLKARIFVLRKEAAAAG